MILNVKRQAGIATVPVPVGSRQISEAATRMMISFGE